MNGDGRPGGPGRGRALGATVALSCDRSWVPYFCSCPAETPARRAVGVRNSSPAGGLCI